MNFTRTKSAADFNPKNNKYFNKLKGNYLKEELQENFEKLVKTDLENPYLKQGKKTYVQSPVTK